MGVNVSLHGWHMASRWVATCINVGSTVCEHQCQGGSTWVSMCVNATLVVDPSDPAARSSLVQCVEAFLGACFGARFLWFLSWPLPLLRIPWAIPAPSGRSCHISCCMRCFRACVAHKASRFLAINVGVNMGLRGGKWPQGGWQPASMFVAPCVNVGVNVCQHL